MKKNWTKELKKYVDEARGLGLFMISAAFFDALLQYPGLTISAFNRICISTPVFGGLGHGAYCPIYLHLQIRKAIGGVHQPGGNLSMLLAGGY